MTESRIELLRTYVGDTHALVESGRTTVGRQVENLAKVSHRDALPAVRELKRVLDQHQVALESRLKALGGSTTAPVKDAVSAVAGAAAGLINAVRPSETVKSLRDDAAYLSGLGVAYLLLYTTACAFADVETAALAQRGYEDSARLTMHFDRILPRVTVEELREEKVELVDPSEQVLAMVKNAWDRERPSGL